MNLCILNNEYDGEKKEILEAQDDEPNSTEVLSSIYSLIQVDPSSKEMLTRQDFDVNSFEFWRYFLSFSKI